MKGKLGRSMSVRMLCPRPIIVDGSIGYTGPGNSTVEVTMTCIKYGQARPTGRTDPRVQTIYLDSLHLLHIDSLTLR